MSAILISRIRVRDAGQMQAYGAAAAPTVAAHGGEVVGRGQFADALLGEGSPHATGIMRFPPSMPPRPGLHRRSTRPCPT
jgi:uncharacterized protein (DUF1330 family)